MWHPNTGSLDGRLKVENGRGGQLHYHNIAYIGSSWITVDNRALPSGLFQLTACGIEDGSTLGSAIDNETAFQHCALQIVPDVFTGDIGESTHSGAIVIGKSISLCRLCIER